MIDELNRVSAELLARLDKQQTPTPNRGPTHELGGVAKASILIEKWLRLVLKYVAELMGTTADTLIAAELGRSLSLGKATGGQLEKVLSAQSCRSAPPCVRLVVKELARRNNRIHRIVEARNSVIHGSDEPASARAALAGLRSFIEEYRRDAGWDSPFPGTAKGAPGASR